MRRLIYNALGWMGWACCELAFRTDCWGPFMYVYRLGNRLYSAETDYGVRHGLLVPNPRFGSHEDEPQLIDA